MQRLNDKIKELREKIYTKKNNRSDNVGSRIFSDLFAGLLLGSFVGYTLDKYLNSLPLFLFICTILGMVGGFYNFYRWYGIKRGRDA